MEFISTRGGECVTGAQAVVKGIASDGGLFVPKSFPAVTAEEFESMLGCDYPERAALLLRKYFDEYEEAGLLDALKEAYSKFEGEDPAPLVRMDNGMYMLELFHGPTCAYKDLSLAIFPYLLKRACELLGVREQLLVLAASGGDTGKAALEHFVGEEKVKVAVFYPEDGVSKMQKLQMCTQDGENVNVVAVRGSFDDCQRSARKIMASEECRALLKERGYLPVSANSMNFGRLAPQIVYYFSAYLDLVSSDQIAMGDLVDFAVPAGDFGNLLAGYYAKRMGLPVGKLICASNKNNALTEFWRTGTYEAQRALYRTMSPSLDVLAASDLERLIFELSGQNAARTAERMASLSAAGKYSIATDEWKAFRALFYAGCASEDDTVECIYDFFEEYGYPMDTHTGVAMRVAQEYVGTLKDDPMSEIHPVVVVSTASPYEFPQDVLYALTGNDVKDSFKGVKRIHLLTAMKVPDPIKAVRYKPIRFKATVSPEKMFDEIVKFL